MERIIKVELIPAMQMPIATLDGFLQYYDNLRDKLETLDYPLFCSDIKSILAKTKTRKELSIQNLAIAIVGSESRLEASIFGNDKPYELALFYRQKPEQLQEILERINSSPDYRIRKFPITGDLTFVPELNTRMPAMLIDSVPLLGDKEVYADFTVELTKQIKDPKIGKSILKSVKEDFKSSIDAFEGFQGRLQNYDLEKGEAYVDLANEDNLKLKRRESFKQGPLRAVQFYLAKEMIKAIRANPNLPNIILEAPAGIEARSIYLENLGILSNKDRQLDKVLLYYKYFLKQYHLSLYNAEAEGIPKIKFNPDKIRERLNSLSGILLRN